MHRETGTVSLFQWVSHLVTTDPSWRRKGIQEETYNNNKKMFSVVMLERILPFFSPPIHSHTDYDTHNQLFQPAL